MQEHLLPLGDYNRIYQTAHGVLECVAPTERSCIFFALFGSYVLSEHYKISARPIAGRFALRVSDGPDVVFFGKNDDEQIVSAADGFHMWVQTQTHIIDFMAPLFREAVANAMSDLVLPRKMFQRPIASQATGLSGLQRTGDFISFSDHKLTKALINGFLSVPVNRDLMILADQCFGSPDADQEIEFAMMSGPGQIQCFSVPTTIATGAW